MKNEIFILNIGLENNGSFKEVVNFLNKINDGKLPIQFHSYKYTESTYLGEKERTLVVKMSHQLKKSVDQVTSWEISIPRVLCKWFTQECIALYGKETKALIYDSNFNGQQHEFNMRFFKK